MFKIKKSWLLAAVIGCSMAPAMADNSFIVDFNATSDAGLPVLGSLFLQPANLTITNDIGPDGTLHQRTNGVNEVSRVTAWSLKEVGGQSLSASFSMDSFFQVDAYLHTDGSSELKLMTREFTYSHTFKEDTSLSFTLVCDCSSLYSAAITASTFAHYDEIRDGEAKVVDTLYHNDPDNDWLYPVGSVEVRTQSVKFSAAAVPEPASVALTLAGGLVLLVRRRRRDRAKH
ncbi:MAG: PEP-CTERM sorting domain-containing protein [Aquabacterium sp.]|uniref:PEP-CTERM sorting domain-containing protein n=1 Tax=Aquabacterium sp. TaxID=1872578 RepID=UPI00271E85A4|nr:PEP-CTERM sorting domain-containing protein [Aquabacterium sp.]MDO9003036.1 PEP-CTERM sorting domain-containing protein [Aquabacterium sp.]